MKYSPRWFIACGLTSLTLAILAGLEISRKEAVSPTQAPSSEERRIERAKPQLPASAPLHGDSRGTPAPPDSPASTAAALESIEAAESPAVLAPYLSSRVPEARAAAVDAMIRLGDPAAVPLLEGAARSLSTEEAAPLLEAARFLALPDASGLIVGKDTAPRPREVSGRKPMSVRVRQRDAQPAAPNGGDQAPPR